VDQQPRKAVSAGEKGHWPGHDGRADQYFVYQRMGSRRAGEKGRLELTMHAEDWIARSEALPFLQFIPVDNHIAVRATQLPGPLHDDPADRIIIATTLSLGGTLITRDGKLRKYHHVKTLW
jgi:PIN domain nuclease of toxin-antitoxin system